MIEYLNRHVAPLADHIIAPANQPLFVCLFFGLLIIALAAALSMWLGDKEEAGPPVGPHDLFH